MTPPVVTVLLPVYNGERYLAAAIDSVLRQTFADFELLVIDDGSTDGTAAILAGCRDPRLVAVRNERNLGLVATLNRGLALARGELVARLDADDVADPARLERQVERFRRDPDLAALGTGIVYIDADGQRTGTPARQAQGPVFLRWRLLRGTCVYHPTLMLHRGRAAQDAHYAAEFTHAEDYELLLRLSRGHRIDNLPDLLVAQRLHAGSVSARFRGEQRASAARALVEHVRLRYGVELGAAQAQALLDPRWLFHETSAVDTSPVRAILELEQRFVASEHGLTPRDRAKVARDVAFFLWKLAAVSLTDWTGGARAPLRLAMLASSAGGLLRRPRAAFAALFA